MYNFNYWFGFYVIFLFVYVLGIINGVVVGLWVIVIFLIVRYFFIGRWIFWWNFDVIVIGFCIGYIICLVWF